MHHLVLGIDPTPLGTAPFTLATDEPVDAWADDVELGLPDAHLHVLPCIAGHVGADTAAAVLQEGPHRGDDVMLLVDVGTNAEIVLGNRERLFAASSPTGPAFEGAQLVVRAARDRRRDRAGAHRPRRRSSRAFKVIGVDAVVGRARLRGAGRGGRRHRRVRLGRDRGDRRAVPRRRDRCRRHDRRRGRRRARRASSRRPHVRVRAARRARPASCASPRTTCARSSSRRPRSTPGVGLLDGPRRRSPTSTRPARRRVRQPHRPGRTRWCSA